MTLSFSRKIFFSLILALFAAPALAVDDVDKAAIEDLRALVAAECKVNTEKCPLDDILARLQKPIEAETTVFNGVVKVKDKDGDVDSDTVARDFFPKVRPKGVTPDEWRALQASGIDGEGIYTETPNSYRLLDLDGDGQRDLIIIRTYRGGEDDELYTRIRSLRRKGGKFERVATFSDEYDNAIAYWIRLRNRAYAVLRADYYGYDDAFLLRPFTANREVPMLTVHYRYQLSVPVAEIKKQEKWLDGSKKEMVLSGEKLSEALTDALQSMSDSDKISRDTPKIPLCPIPASVKGDDRAAYYAYAENMEYETRRVVGDMSIHIGDKCYIGRLSYPEGLSELSGILIIRMRMLDYFGADDLEFEVSGTRKTISVKSSTTKCDENRCY